MQHVFVQAGCYVQPCGWLRRRIDEYPDSLAYIIEANRFQWPVISKAIVDKGYEGRIELISKACWDVDDQEITFYTGAGRKETTVGASALSDKWRRAPTKTVISKVQTMDFSKFVAEHNEAGRCVHVIMDIEGAEFRILSKMIADNTLRIIGRLDVEWHAHKMRSDKKEFYKKWKHAILEYWNTRPNPVPKL